MQSPRASQASSPYPPSHPQQTLTYDDGLNTEFQIADACPLSVSSLPHDNEEDTSFVNRERASTDIECRQTMTRMSVSLCSQSSAEWPELRLACQEEEEEEEEEGEGHHNGNNSGERGQERGVSHADPTPAPQQQQQQQQHGPCREEDANYSETESNEPRIIHIGRRGVLSLRPADEASDSLFSQFPAFSGDDDDDELLSCTTEDWPPLFAQITEEEQQEQQLQQVHERLREDRQLHRWLPKFCEEHEERRLPHVYVACSPTTIKHRIPPVMEVAMNEKVFFSRSGVEVSTLSADTHVEHHDLPRRQRFRVGGGGGGGGGGAAASASLISVMPSAEFLLHALLRYLRAVISTWHGESTASALELLGKTGRHLRDLCMALGIAVDPASVRHQDEGGDTTPRPASRPQTAANHPVKPPCCLSPSSRSSSSGSTPHIHASVLTERNLLMQKTEVSNISALYGCSVAGLTDRSATSSPVPQQQQQHRSNHPPHLFLALYAPLWELLSLPVFSGVPSGDAGCGVRHCYAAVVDLAMRFLYAHSSNNMAVASSTAAKPPSQALRSPNPTCPASSAASSVVVLIGCETLPSPGSAELTARRRTSAAAATAADAADAAGTPGEKGRGGHEKDGVVGCDGEKDGEEERSVFALASREEEAKWLPTLCQTPGVLELLRLALSSPHALGDGSPAVVFHPAVCRRAVEVLTRFSLARWTCAPPSVQEAVAEDEEDAERVEDLASFVTLMQERQLLELVARQLTCSTVPSSSSSSPPSLSSSPSRKSLAEDTATAATTDAPLSPPDDGSLLASATPSSSPVPPPTGSPDSLGRRGQANEGVHWHALEFLSSVCRSSYGALRVARSATVLQSIKALLLRVESKPLLTAPMKASAGGTEGRSLSSAPASVLFPPSHELTYAALRVLERAFKGCDSTAVDMLLGRATGLLPVVVDLLRRKLERQDHRAVQAILRLFAYLIKGCATAGAHLAAGGATEERLLLGTDGFLGSIIACLSTEADSDSAKGVIKAALHALACLPPPHATHTGRHVLSQLFSKGVFSHSLLWLSGKAEKAGEMEDGKDPSAVVSSPSTLTLTATPPVVVTSGAVGAGDRDCQGSTPRVEYEQQPSQQHSLSPHSSSGLGLFLRLREEAGGGGRPPAPPLTHSSGSQRQRRHRVKRASSSSRRALPMMVTPIQREAAELLYTLSSHALAAAEWTTTTAQGPREDSPYLDYLASNLSVLTVFLQHFTRSGHRGLPYPTSAPTAGAASPASSAAAPWGANLKKLELRALTLVLQSIGHILERQLNPRQQQAGGSRGSSDHRRCRDCLDEIERCRLVPLLAALGTNMALLAQGTELPRIALQTLEMVLTASGVSEANRLDLLLSLYSPPRGASAAAATATGKPQSDRWAAVMERAVLASVPPSRAGATAAKLSCQPTASHIGRDRRAAEAARPQPQRQEEERGEEEEGNPTGPRSRAVQSTSAAAVLRRASRQDARNAFLRQFQLELPSDSRSALAGTRSGAAAQTTPAGGPPPRDDSSERSNNSSSDSETDPGQAASPGDAAHSSGGGNGGHRSGRHATPLTLFIEALREGPTALASSSTLHRPPPAVTALPITPAGEEVGGTGRACRAAASALPSRGHSSGAGNVLALQQKRKMRVLRLLRNVLEVPMDPREKLSPRAFLSSSTTLEASAFLPDPTSASPSSALPVHPLLTPSVADAILFSDVAQLLMADVQLLPIQAVPPPMALEGLRLLKALVGRLRLSVPPVLAECRLTIPSNVLQQLLEPQGAGGSSGRTNTTAGAAVSPREASRASPLRSPPSAALLQEGPSLHEARMALLANAVRQRVRERLHRVMALRIGSSLLMEVNQGATLQERLKHSSLVVISGRGSTSHVTPSFTLPSFQLNTLMSAEPHDDPRREMQRTGGGGGGPRHATVVVAAAGAGPPPDTAAAVAQEEDDSDNSPLIATLSYSPACMERRGVVGSTMHCRHVSGNGNGNADRSSRLARRGAAATQRTVGGLREPDTSQTHRRRGPGDGGDEDGVQAVVVRQAAPEVSLVGSVVTSSSTLAQGIALEASLAVETVNHQGQLGGTAGARGLEDEGQPSEAVEAAATVAAITSSLSAPEVQEDDDDDDDDGNDEAAAAAAAAAPSQPAAPAVAVARHDASGIRAATGARNGSVRSGANRGGAAAVREPASPSAGITSSAMHEAERREGTSLRAPQRPPSSSSPSTVPSTALPDLSAQMPQGRRQSLASSHVVPLSPTSTGPVAVTVASAATVMLSSALQSAVQRRTLNASPEDVDGPAEGESLTSVVRTAIPTVGGAPAAAAAAAAATTTTPSTSMRVTLQEIRRRQQQAQRERWARARQAREELNLMRRPCADTASATPTTASLCVPTATVAVSRRRGNNSALAATAAASSLSASPSGVDPALDAVKVPEWSELDQRRVFEAAVRALVCLSDRWHGERTGEDPSGEDEQHDEARGRDGDNGDDGGGGPRVLPSSRVPQQRSGVAGGEHSAEGEGAVPVEPCHCNDSGGNEEQQQSTPRVVHEYSPQPLQVVAQPRQQHQSQQQHQEWLQRVQVRYSMLAERIRVRPPSSWTAPSTNTNTNTTNTTTTALRSLPLPSSPLAAAVGTTHPALLSQLRSPEEVSEVLRRLQTRPLEAYLRCCDRERAGRAWALEEARSKTPMGWSPTGRGVSAGTTPRALSRQWAEEQYRSGVKSALGEFTAGGPPSALDGGTGGSTRKDWHLPRNTNTAKRDDGVLWFVGSHHGQCSAAPLCFDQLMSGDERDAVAMLLRRAKQLNRND